MKKIVIGLAAAFAVTLAVVIGKQMSADAMAVVVGVVCGIGASIPTSLLMLFVITRKEQAQQQQQQQQQRAFPQVPAVMIVNPPAGQISPYYQATSGSYLPPLNGGQRQFQVLGADEFDSDGRY